MQITSLREIWGIIPWQIWLIWLMGTCFALYQFILQLSTGIIVVDVMHAFHLTASEAGIFSGTFYFVYASLQTPAGLLLDRFGARLLLSTTSLFCAVGCFLLGMSHHYALALLSRVLMGIGCAFAFVGAVQLLRDWFPKDSFSTLIGLMETTAMFNCLFSTLLIAKLVQLLGWRISIQLFGYAALFISLGCLTIIRDKGHYYQASPRKAPSYSFKQSFLSIITNPILWLNGLYCGIMFLVVTLFGALWAIPFLQSELQCSLPIATFIAAMIYIGVAVGCPTVAYLSSRYNHYRSILFVGGILTTVSITLILFAPIRTAWILAILYFSCGLSCSPYIINFTLANQIAPNHAKSASIGFTNTLCIITAPLFQYLTGLGITLHHRSTASLMDTAYNYGDFQFGLSILPLALFVATLIALFLPEK